MTSENCEKKDMGTKVQEFHNQKALALNLPKTLLDNSCSRCSGKFEPESIRNIGLCLNARNFGEISMEVFCNTCSCIETLYFREDIQSVQEFCNLLMTEDAIKTEPLTEEKMYSLKYNNIVQQMFCAENKSGEKNDTV